LEKIFGQFSLDFTFNTVTKNFVIVLVGYFDNMIEIDKDRNVKRRIILILSHELVRVIVEQL
jgi:hypothetical protein